MTEISNFELFQKLHTFSRYTHRHHFGPGEMPPGPHAPGEFPPGPHAHGEFPPGPHAPGDFPPGPHAHGEFPPGPHAHGEFPPGPHAPGQFPPGPPMDPPRPGQEAFCPPPHRDDAGPHGGMPFGMGPDPHFNHPRGERPPFPPCGPEGPHRRPPRRPPLSREHLLVIINRYPDGIRQKNLAKIAEINQSSTSELISKLENDGYVKRTVDPSDKRATLLFLTELGQARAAEVEDERDAAFEDFFNVLSEEEKQTLSDILDKLIAAQELKRAPKDTI